MTVLLLLESTILYEWEVLEEIAELILSHISS